MSYALSCFSFKFIQAQAVHLESDQPDSAMTWSC